MLIFGKKRYNRSILFDKDGGSGGGATTPPANNQTTQPATGNQPPEQNTATTKDEGKSTEELRKLREENERLKNAQKERDTKEAEKKGEFEKLYLEMKTQNETLKEQQKKAAIKSQVTFEAKDMGLKNREFIKLFDMDGLELDSSGNVVDLQHKMKAFKEQYPELFTGGGTNTKGDGDNKNDVPSTDQSKRPFSRGVDTDDLSEIETKIKDRKTSPRERSRLIAKRLSLLQKKRQ